MSKTRGDVYLVSAGIALHQIAYIALLVASARSSQRERREESVDPVHRGLRGDVKET